MRFMSINCREIPEGGETNPKEKRSDPVSNTGHLIVKDNDNIFIELYAKEIGSVMHGKIMEKSTKKSLNANWCNSSTSQKEENK